MATDGIHFEEYLYLPALTHNAVLIAWGGFFFEVDEHHGKTKWKLLDADKVGDKVPSLKGVKELIGQNSKPYGSRDALKLPAPANHR